MYATLKCNFRKISKVKYFIKKSLKISKGHSESVYPQIVVLVLL